MKKLLFLLFALSPLAASGHDHDRWEHRGYEWHKYHHYNRGHYEHRRHWNGWNWEWLDIWVWDDDDYGFLGPIHPHRSLAYDGNGFWHRRSA